MSSTRSSSRYSRRWFVVNRRDISKHSVVYQPQNPQTTLSLQSIRGSLVFSSIICRDLGGNPYRSSTLFKCSSVQYLLRVHFPTAKETLAARGDLWLKQSVHTFVLKYQPMIRNQCAKEILLIDSLRFGNVCLQSQTESDSIGFASVALITRQV